MTGVAGFRLLVPGLAVLVIGVGPLLLYALVGPADGNPVGFGLLAFVAMPVGGVLAVLGFIRVVIFRVSTRSVERNVRPSG